ncbi:MAG: hypothetical protein AVDCRST_MAG18-2546 [uncultured Thermomicrobiales bacterium]|uniref:Uncharacterized protein n=1 Tax=uncultured Thermomicrobiales bacterium TaxID=1645740 RepID=A0A6J4VD89_9BACT|nr:MAG: hypothetical protein AVDCRST_MAG18-2546 [uncultured Thermomicrobiales bacterium]
MRERAFAALGGEAGDEYAMIAAAIVRAHQHAAGARNKGALRGVLVGAESRRIRSGLGGEPTVAPVGMVDGGGATAAARVGRHREEPLAPTEGCGPYHARDGSGPGADLHSRLRVLLGGGPPPCGRATATGEVGLPRGPAIGVQSNPFTIATPLRNAFPSLLGWRGECPHLVLTCSRMMAINGLIAPSQPAQAGFVAQPSAGTAVHRHLGR